MWFSSGFGRQYCLVCPRFGADTSAAISAAQKQKELEQFPRTKLAHLPTPLEYCPRLSKALNGVNIYIKRDDCTGLATGGNKARKLEWLMAEALEQGADMVMTQGATQSNHCRQTAAAAAKLGLKCHVLLEERIKGDADYNENGNVMLDDMFGATREKRGPNLDMAAELEAAAEEYRKKGHKVYVIPGGGSNPTGALGYVNCAYELVQQIEELGIYVDHICHATGSTGTQATTFFAGPMGWFFGCCVGAAGAVWSWLMVRHQSILGAWLAHMLVDLCLMGVGYWLIFFVAPAN